MAWSGSYPLASVYPQMDGSEMAVVDGMQSDIAANGDVRLRELYPSPKRTWTVKHWLTNAQWATYYADYLVAKLTKLTFTWAQDGVAYTNCVIGGAPQVKPLRYNLNEITVTILESQA